MVSTLVMLYTLIKEVVKTETIEEWIEYDRLEAAKNQYIKRAEIENMPQTFWDLIFRVYKSHPFQQNYE